MTAPESTGDTQIAWTPESVDRLSRTLASHAQTVEQAPAGTIAPQRLSEADGTAGERTLVSLARVHADPEARIVVDEEELGRGGMSVVNLGTQTSLDRKVAIKSPVSSEDAHARSLLREAWITGQLEHPNVMPVHDLAVEDGRPLVVLKRIEGVEWTKLLEDEGQVQERFEANDVVVWHLRTLVQVCNAVHFAHTRGIVHRDLKPSNVMIGAFGEVYVTDWGIAVSIDPDGPASYDPSMLAGTPAYIAPESLFGKRVDGRTDVYLLGGILYEILAGKSARDAPNLHGMIAQAVAEDPPELPKHVAPDLAAICRRCLRREPEDRFASVDDLRRAVEKHLQRRDSLALSLAAEESLAELERLTAAANPDGEHPTELYDLYGGCRFGFRAALRAWPDNVDARHGVERAVTAMVSMELDRGSPQSAKALLADLTTPPVELRERVEDALAAEAARRGRAARILADNDPEVGRKGRFFAAALLTGPILLAPLLQYFNSQSLGPEDATELYAWRVVVPLAQGAVLIGLWLWRRKLLLTNKYNLRLFQAAMLVFVAQSLLAVAHWIGGVDPVHSNVENYAVLTMGIAVLTVFVDPRLWLATLVYLLTFILSWHTPANRHLYVLFADFVLCASLLWIWRPRRRAT